LIAVNLFFLSKKSAIEASSDHPDNVSQALYLVADSGNQTTELSETNNNGAL
jgi:hypothetical protein